jgi:parallel beta-helix repeat protein
MAHRQGWPVGALAVISLAAALILIAAPRQASLADGIILYVDADATGTNNGSSWADAYTTLQPSLDAAVAGQQIWVAAGTYKPTDGADRTISFQMKNEVAIYGGFDPSVGDDTSEERDWEANVTILSGDIGTAGDSTDNVYHVFYHPAGTALDITAILDGFTITGGNANGDPLTDDSWGGGMLNDGSSPTLANVTFRGNSAVGSGGGMYNTNSSAPTLDGCTFADNAAVGSGGGMHNSNASSPALTNCTFANNAAGTEGGGIHNDGSSPTLTGCTLSGNSADAGGGIYNGSDSQPELVACIFQGNSANSGGGMHNDGSSPVLVNCTFQGNTAGGNGGGMRNTRSSAPTVTNCTFQGNRATNGGAIHNYLSSSPALTNCILWGDSKPEIVNMEGSTAFVAYSDVEGSYLYPGTGNINEDPLFLDVAHGDLNLRPGSPCIDAGSNAAPYLPAYDFEGDDRILDGDGDGEPVVDMGVDEAFWYPVYLPLVLKGY